MGECYIIRLREIGLSLQKKIHKMIQSGEMLYQNKELQAAAKFTVLLPTSPESDIAPALCIISGQRYIEETGECGEYTRIVVFYHESKKRI